MNLLLDLGNTRLKWAIAAGAQWTVGDARADGSPDQVLTALGPAPAPQRIWLSAVGEPARAAALIAALESRFECRVHRVEAEPHGFGIRNHYRDPARLGADRWAALVGARAMCPGALCVVDGGTACTVDLLSADGDYLGGAIFPGLAVLRGALAAALPSLPLAGGNDHEPLARSTSDGVAAGTRFGLAGAIERLVAEYERVAGTDLTVILCGGDAGMLARTLNRRAQVVPDLVLRGLQVMAERSP